MKVLEEQLLTECRKGNKDAFAQLVRTHANCLYHLVLPMVRVREDAKDIVQDAFLHAYEGIGNFRGASSLQTWLCAIALNAARDYLRKNRMIPIPYSEESASEAQTSEDPHIGQVETAIILKEALQTLSAEYKEILILRDMMGFSYEEIAEIQQIGLGTVKSRLSRARCACTVGRNLMNNNTSDTCDDRWKEWISRHLDGDLNEEETEELQAHFRECDSCFRYYAQMNRLKHALDTLPKEDWNDAWTEETVKRFKRGKWKKLDLKRIVWLSAAILVVAVFAVSFVQQIVLTGGNSAEYGTVGSAAPENGGLAASDTNKGTDSSASGSGYASGAGSTDAAPMTASEIDPDKIIYSGTLSLYAGNLKQTITDISVYVQSIGGFVESSYYSLNTDASYEYSSYGTVQLRVPVEQYDAAMQTLQSYGKVASSYTYSENVTQSYRDVQSELDSYRIQEGKLNELLKQAVSVSDMLSIETELNRIRTEIDTREAILQNYDNLIAYSSITVTLYEQDISSANIQSPFGNLWQNIKEAFIKSVNIFLTAIEKLILIIFYLLPFAFAATVIVIIVRLARRKKGLLPPKTKNAEQSESVEESADTQNEPKK